MSRDYQTTVDLLIQRVRQTGGIAVTQNFATEILGKCERILNAFLKRVIASTAFATAARQQIYPYRSTLTAAVDILEVTESSRSLFKCDRIEQFTAYEVDWFRNITGTRFEAWHQIARDFLIIYPAKNAVSSVTVTYTKLVDAYSTYAAASGNNMSLPDDDVETALALAEIVLLMRSRNAPQVPVRLTQFLPLVGLQQMVK